MAIAEPSAGLHGMKVGGELEEQPLVVSPWAPSHRKRGVDDARREHWGVKHVGTTGVRKPAGAQAALWAYAFVALLALFPPAMTDDMLPIALVYSLIGLYVAGLFVVDLVGRLDHGVLRSWIAATAIVAVIISPIVAHNL